MSTRSERDKGKASQERHQAILSALLKDEDNKYCVDCDAKGPRWASWNLGIFLCIRCAGIHRNLGVHISKVKSVNLDSWTAEQIAMMQEMGNSLARKVYEANKPDNIKRPQTDSGLEAFIRAKYEQKKYMAKDWVPTQPKVPVYTEEETRKEKKKSRATKAAPVSVPVASPKKTTEKPKTETKKNPEPPKSSASVDLLGLDDNISAPASSPSSDLFGDFIASSCVMNQTVSSTTPSSSAASNLLTSTTTTTATNGTKDSTALNDINLFDDQQQQQQQQQASDGKKSKDSILALYGPSMAANNMGMQQQMPQQNMYAFQGNYGNMYNSGQPMMMQQGMMQQQLYYAYPMTGNMMSGMQTGNYNMQGLYGMQQFPQQQQQQQYTQMQQQFGSMNISTPAYQMSSNANSTGQWGQQTAGQTLSNNLWQ